MMVINSYREIPGGDPSSQASLKGDTTFQRALHLHKGGRVPWRIFLLMTVIFLIRTTLWHYHEQEPAPSARSDNALSKSIDHFLKSNEEADPMWSYSALYDEDDVRLQEHGAVLTDLYEKHAKFLWIEVGVMLFAPHLNLPRLFRSPTMRAVFRQQGGILSKNIIKAVSKTCKTIKKYYSRYSPLSEATHHPDHFGRRGKVEQAAPSKAH